MYTAGTTACCAMFVQPGSPGRMGAVKEGGKGKRKFFSSNMSLRSRQ